MPTLTVTGTSFDLLQRSFGTGPTSLQINLATTPPGGNGPEPVLELRNPSTGLRVWIEGEGVLFVPNNFSIVEDFLRFGQFTGTITTLTFISGGFTTTEVAQATDLTWSEAGFWNAILALGTGDLAPFAALLNSAPLTVDGSTARDDFRINSIFGDLLPLITTDMTVLGGPAYDTLIGGRGNDLIVTGANGGAINGGLYAATLGNDTIDFSQAASTQDGMWISYSARVDGAFTFNLDLTAAQSTITGAGATDTLLDLANLVTVDGVGFGAGEGNDVFNLTSIDDGFINLWGNQGSDTFNLVMNGGTVRLGFLGGADAFDFSYLLSTQALHIDVSQGIVFNDGWGSQDRLNIAGNRGVLEIQGTRQSDTIIGSNRDESFISEGGDDTITGGDGHDVLRFDRTSVDGGVSVNLWRGDAQGIWSTKAFLLSFTSIEEVIGTRDADDAMVGDDAAQTFVGLGGNDRLLGNGGRDSLSGGDGDDTMHGGTGADTIEGGTGGDSVEGGFGQDLVFLNSGDDLFQDVGQGGAFGADTVFGGDGNDTINGSAGADEFNGGSGTDSIEGGLGFDALFGGGGADTLSGGEGNDTVAGGNGRDLVFLNQGNDVFNDNDQGGPFGADTVFGGLGNDTLNGGAGADELHGGDGFDSIEGGLGFDLIFGGNQADAINAGNGNDTVFGGNGRDRVDLGNGDDVFNDNGQGGDAGRDTVFGGAGNDTLNGGAGGDSFNGGSGRDVINGGAGDDIIFGVAGADTLRGGDGADTLSGGAGDDVLTGGAGADTFSFLTIGTPLGSDVITDFEFGTDILTLVAVSADQITVTYDAGVNEVAVNFGINTLATLQSTGDLSGFGVDDIVFV